MSVPSLSIIQGWYRLVGAHPRVFKRILFWTLVAASLGAALGVWQALERPPLYQVEVSLAVYPTHYRWMADSHLQTLNRPRGDARQMAMVMAKGPEVLDMVIREMGDRLPPSWRTRKELVKHLSVRGGEGVYAYLTVNGTDPQLTHDLATTWAKATKTVVEKAFYRYDSDIPLLKEQAQELETRLNAMEKKIEQFRVRTGLALVDESRAAIIISDYQGLRPGLAGFNARVLELGTVNGDLAAYRHAQAVLRDLATQVRQAKADGRPLQDVPLELVSTLGPVQARGQLTYERLREMGSDYDRVAQALTDEADALQAGIDLLDKQSITLRQGLAADITELRALIRQRSSVENLYKALLAKQNELRAEAAVSSHYVEIVDIHTPNPSRAFRLLLYLVAGAILGGFLGFTLSTTWYSVRRPTA